MSRSVILLDWGGIIKGKIEYLIVWNRWYLIFKVERSGKQGRENGHQCNGRGLRVYLLGRS